MCRPPTTPGQRLALLPHQPALALRSRCRGRCPRCVYVGGSSPPQPSRSVCPSPTGEAVGSRTLRRGAPDRRGAPGRGPWRRRVLEGAGSLIACQHALLLFTILCRSKIARRVCPVRSLAPLSGTPARPRVRRGSPHQARHRGDPRRSSPMIGRRWGPCGRWSRQLPDAQDGRLRAGCGAAPLRIAPVSSASACGLVRQSVIP